MAQGINGLFNVVNIIWLNVLVMAAKHGVESFELSVAMSHRHIAYIQVTSVFSIGK